MERSAQRITKEKEIEMNMIKDQDLPQSFYDRWDFMGDESVKTLLNDVQQNGDRALMHYTQKFDGVTLEQFRVPRASLEKALERLPPELRTSLEIAKHQISLFAQHQMESLKAFEIALSTGVKVGQRLIPIQRAGIYAPGGRYPLPSSVMMGIIPAITAGVSEVVLCSPPGKNGELSEIIQATAALCGAWEVYAIGGAQAIAAMAYGTESIPAVDFIAGPGNRFVTEAKRLVFGRVGIDFIAGPSEVLIIADDTANPKYVAADLLAQAEHDPEASSILLSLSQALACEVEKEIKHQLSELSTSAIATQSMQNRSWIVLCQNMESAIAIANQKAPEHLELAISNPQSVLSRLRNYGALFLGHHSAEALGDYIAGPNHTLPTNGVARYCGGLSVLNFIKIVTTLDINPEGISHLGPPAIQIAQAEGLHAHARAIQLRLRHP